MADLRLLPRYYAVFLLLIISITNSTSYIAPTSGRAVALDPWQANLSSNGYGYRVLAGQHSVLGVQQALVILVDFEDVRHTKSPDQVRDVAVDQLNVYYNEVSYGKVSIAGQVFGWYTLPEPMSYYGHDRQKPGDDENKDQLAFNALLKLPSSLDLTPFQYFVIVHAGQDQADDQNRVMSDEIWSSCSCSVFPYYGTVDPIYVGSKVFVNYAFLSEFSGVGTYAHEWGHLFGLPDLYDTTTSGNSFVGYWSLMDVGSRCCGNATESTPSYPGGWAATLLGWVAPTVADSRILVSTFPLYPLETPNVTVILIPVSLLTYYFIEYRSTTGSDSHLSGSGILVYLVDEGLENGVIKLVNPQTGKPFPSQKRTMLNAALFNSRDQLIDDINRVYVGFSKSSDLITALYSKLGLTGNVVPTNLAASLTSVESTYGDQISFGMTLLDGGGHPLTGQEINAVMFDSMSKQWLDIGSSVTDQQGHITFVSKLIIHVGGYLLRLLFPGGRNADILYASSHVEIRLQILPARMLITMTAPVFVLGAEYHVEVSVVDSRGEPLKGVSVELYVNNVRREVVQTNASGKSDLALQLGSGEIGHVLVANATLVNYDVAEASMVTLNLASVLILTLAAAALIGIAIWKRKGVKAIISSI